MLSQKQRILITGGGSGGHIIPNLAIIDELKKISATDHHALEFLYLCSRSQLDQTILTANKIHFKPIFTWKIRRYFDFRIFYEFIFLIIGFIQSLIIIFTFKPQVVFCKGGFVSVPVAFAAFFLRQKIIAHESDIKPGLANKIINKLAHKICSGYPLPREKFIYTGNPLRTGVRRGNKNQGYQFTNFKNSQKTLLIMGGSQGALPINELISEILPGLAAQIQIIHLTGENKSFSFNHHNYRQYSYLPGSELFDLYQITDLALTRGGANSLNELAVNFIPMLIIPLPSSANHHQFYNAQYYQNLGGAVVLEQTSLNSSQLKTTILNLIDSSKLKTMRQSLSKITPINAASKIARIILNYY